RYFRFWRLRLEEISLNSVLDDRQLFAWHVVTIQEIVAKCWRNYDDVIGTLVEEFRHGAERSVYEGSLVAHANGRQRLWPQVSHFKDEWNSFRARHPPSGKSDE